MPDRLYPFTFSVVSVGKLIRSSFANQPGPTISKRMEYPNHGICKPTKMELMTQSGLTSKKDGDGIVLGTAKPGDVLYRINDPNCEVLDLSSMSITDIQRAAFNQTTVRVLSLEDNELESVNSNMWEGLYLESTLGLSRNQIRHIAPDTWKHMGDIEMLTLSKNPLTLYEGVFKGLSNLEILQLQSCGITNIEEGTFDGLGRLRSLYMSSNELTEIKAGTWRGLESLIYLSLSGNHIVSIAPSVFSQLHNLLELSLSGNPLSNLQGDIFTGLQSLRTLQIENCEISQLSPNLFANLKSLESLNLQRNDLEFTKNMWKGLENLQEMWLKENHIGVLRSGSFIGLQSLTELELAFNELTYIEPGALAGLPQIKVLKLWYNNLTTLESNIFDTNDFPNTFGHPVDIDIRLESNPIQCTESICWLHDAVPPEVDEYESSYYDYLYPPIEFPSGFSMDISERHSRERRCANPWCWSSNNIGSLTALGIFCEEYQ